VGGVTNKEWHAANALGSGASLDRRVDWHLAHAAVCGCRPIPEKIRQEILARRIDLPVRPT
jgi:hypothetical protein